MGYTRIEASRAGRHLQRPYGERDMGLRMTQVCRTRGRTGAAEGKGEGGAGEAVSRLHRELTRKETT